MILMTGNDMDIIFLTLTDISDFHEHGVYKDLIREFAAHGHRVYAVSPDTAGNKTHMIQKDNVTILRLKTPVSRGISGKIKKGIATLSVGSRFVRGIKRFFGDVTFDLVLYATPPVTLYHAVRYLKRRDNAFCYLMLKDIFPQNAVDLGMMAKAGAKSEVYRYFKRLEKRLYAISDRIGCMSEANRRYLLAHYEGISPRKIEILPNSIEVCDFTLTDKERLELRKKYAIPSDKTVFVYGGNLGKPQDIPFVIECLKRETDDPRAFFLLVGKGSEYPHLVKYIGEAQPLNVQLIPHMPREDYDRMIAACDVGLIFLDHRFTIPNFPSRLLAYMQARLPVIACTDVNTDVGDVIEQGDFGVHCTSDDPENFTKAVRRIIDDDRLREQGNNAYEYLMKYYTVSRSYEIIMENIYEIPDHQHRR